MQRASRIAILITSLLGCACALADESEIPFDPAVSVSNDRLPLVLKISSDSYRLIEPLEFQDNSTLGRLKRLREVSFLTLAQSKKSRLFLGVNSDGLVGLHMRVR